MYSRNFAMNLVHISLASWTIFKLVQEAVSLKEAVMLREYQGIPLAVIKKNNSSLQLAIPHVYKPSTYHPYVSYSYDDSEDENGPKEEMMIACPAQGEKQLQVEKDWKTRVLTTKESTLLFLYEYTNRDALCSSRKFQPSINKVEENSDDLVNHCNQLDADMYEVGYPVSNDDEGKDIKFLSTYKICYSNIEDKEATLYSIHRIESPDLLFMGIIREPNEHATYRFWHYHESILDSNLSTIDSILDMKNYKYQFVGLDDMPSDPWKRTTYFLFNYTAITRNKDLFKGVIRVDWYIRLYSYKKNMPLNLYSGTRQKVIQDAPPVDSFWRVILDDAGNAIILVTQHTQKKCDQDYLCEKNRQVKTYEAGGCIYTCSLETNENLLRELGLSFLKINGDLDFTLQTDETEVATAEGPETSNTKPTHTTGIIEFLDNESFKDALLNIDKKILKIAGFRDESSW
ncbi:uncharacterized protein LOC135837898 [Planococcus citri]|uniref:uncharacterized protein LOC135837898 n=1 Tax=Planococcus citri TaxID=170843 RepID=UPI0031F7B37E